MNTIRTIIILLISISSLKSQEFSFKDFFDQHSQLKKIAKNENYRVQIIYTQINRDQNNQPSFKQFSFQVTDSTYFYPASTVKMPTAFLALQRLNELGIERTTPLKIGANRFPQTAVVQDTTSKNKLPSIAHYINKVFTVSDNDAFNRLFEFLGQEYIHTELRKKGFNHSKIAHRLVGGYDGVENSYINPFWFYKNNELIYERPGLKSSFNFTNFDKLEALQQGKGYYSGGKIIDQPFDFSSKNYISLTNLTDQLKTVLFPEAHELCEQFNIRDEDYQFLYNSMSQLPQESDYPNYSYEDNYVKFILYGDEDKSFAIPDHIKVLNKVGFAYGYLTDVAYVADNKTEVEFMLSVQMLVNENEIFNDGVYEYNSIGIPFMGKLGKAIYQYEQTRNRTYKPDLSKFYQ